MTQDDYAKLLEDAEREILNGSRSVGILGFTTTTFRLLESLSLSGCISTVEAIYSSSLVKPSLRTPVVVRCLAELANANHDLLIVAADDEKEELLRAARPFVAGSPKVVISGYGHFKFRNRIFEEELSQLLVPSLANGYPNTLVHLYQCLVNAARLNLAGAVVEFGMFKGGTTMFLARVIERLGMNWPVFGFDTFDGFPPRRSFLDLYDHPGCVFRDLPAVQRYVDGSRITVISGDVVETCHRLRDHDLVLSFIDTDNYTSAKAILEVVQERTIVHGAIVFDHFTGTNRFCYTLGERIAASVLLEDSRYLNLHGTGVFYRQR